MPLVCTTYRCDRCDKLVEVDGSMLPEEWIMVQKQAIRAMLCSWECANQFTQKRLQNPDPDEDKVETK